MFVFQSDRGLQRCSGLTRRLPGVAEMDPCLLFRCPSTTVAPSRLDWRILEILHGHPTTSIAECARKTGITAKTFARRYNSLVRDCAVWSVPRLDFTRYQGASVVRFLVWLGPKTDSQRILGRLESSFSSYILLEDQSGRPDAGPKAVRLLSVFLQLTSPGEVEDSDRLIRENEGVEEVEAYFPRRIYVYEDWSSEQLENRTRVA